jgi:hypothetical protein
MWDLRLGWGDIEAKTARKWVGGWSQKYLVLGISSQNGHYPSIWVAMKVRMVLATKSSVMIPAMMEPWDQIRGSKGN